MNKTKIAILLVLSGALVFHGCNNNSKQPSLSPSISTTPIENPGTRIDNSQEPSVETTNTADQNDAVQDFFSSDQEKSQAEAPLDIESIPSPPPDSERSSVPDFMLQDLYDQKVSLSSYKGKVVVLNFWASWCDPCKEKLTEFQSLDEEFAKSNDAVLLMINMTDGIQETKESARKFLTDNGFTFNTLLDTTGNIAKNYDVTDIPTTVVIDKNGNFVALKQGPVSKEEILQVVDQAMKIE